MYSTEAKAPSALVLKFIVSQMPVSSWLTRWALRVALSFSHCALALGIAQGALDDIAALSKTKSASMNPRQKLCEDVLFRHELGQNAVKLDAAKSFLDQFTAKAWQTGVDKRQLTPEEILTGRLMAGFITEQSTAIVDWAYTRAGSTGVYDGSSLQMRMRECLERMGAAPFAAGSDELNNLEYYLTYLSNGLAMRPNTWRPAR